MRRALTAAAAAAALAVLLLVAPARARADEGDAEDRFHRAYEAEVVEGKLADAAKTYLDLMHDEKAPPKLRAEARFRFAVTAMLLGRADEARAHFAELKDDASLSSAMRARAAEYLESAKSIGVGSEVDKKLQALLFDLGRVPASERKPAVYRDFEILGKAAIPFLRGLLAHEDAAIRGHAFRLLLRLDAPGIAEAWTPALTSDSATANPFLAGELREYLGRHADESERYIRRLLALDDAALQRVFLAGNFWGPASPELLRAALSRGVPTSQVAGLLRSAVTAEGGPQLRDEWLRSDDPALARAATFSFLAAARKDPSSVTADLTTVRAIVTRLTGVGTQWQLSSLRALPAEQREGEGAYREAEGLATLASRCPADGALELFSEIVATCEGWKGNVEQSPLRTGLADALAVAVEDTKPTGAALTRHASLVLRLTAAATSSKSFDQSYGILNHLRYLLGALPQDEAEQAAAQLVSGPAAAGASTWVRALPADTARDFAVALAAYRVAAVPIRPLIRKEQLPSDGRTVPDPARAAAILDALPELTRSWTEQSRVPLYEAFPPLARAAPPDRVGPALVVLARWLASDPDPAARSQGLYKILDHRSNDPEVSADYFAKYALPVAEPVLAALPGVDRGQFLMIATSVFRAHRDPATREAIRSLLLTNVEDAPSHMLRQFADDPDLFPLADWVPRANAEQLLAAFFASPKPAPEVVAAAIAAMAPEPEKANAAVRVFVRRTAPPEVAGAFYDRVLRGADMKTLAEAVFELRSRTPDPKQLAAPVSADALDVAVDRAVAAAAAAPLPPGLLRNLVNLALALRPSERLFPAIRLLLASSERGDVRDGIAAAQSLGRADLLPALTEKLDSLDVEVRNAARAAIDNIAQLRRMRLAEEARRRGVEPAGGEAPAEEPPPK